MSRADIEGRMGRAVVIYLGGIFPAESTGKDKRWLLDFHGNDRDTTLLEEMKIAVLDPPFNETYPVNIQTNGQDV